MPPNVRFHLPFPSKISPDASIAEAHTVQWLLEHGLLNGQQQAEYFEAMRIGTAAARWYPEAEGADLDLGADAIAFISVVNDHIGSASPQRRQAGAVTCAHLITLLSGADEPVAPFGTAWCDLSARLSEGMSATWQARLRRNLANLLNGYLNPPQSISTVQDCINRRGSIGGTAWFLDLAERFGRYEVPQQALDTPLVRELTDECTKLLFLPNDVIGVEREEARGETHNMVLVLEHATGRSRDEAIAEIQQMVKSSSERFLFLERQLPRTVTELGLSTQERTAVQRHVQAMRHMIRGCYEWQTAGTSRYAPEDAIRALASGYEISPELR